jgi:ribosomal protein L7Ae-like RNA K-turn-binding protein
VIPMQLPVLQRIRGWWNEQRATLNSTSCPTTNADGTVRKDNDTRGAGGVNNTSIESRSNNDPILGQGAPFKTLHGKTAWGFLSKSKPNLEATQQKNGHILGQGASFGTQQNNNPWGFLSKSKPNVETTQPKNGQILGQGVAFDTCFDKRTIDTQSINAQIPGPGAPFKSCFEKPLIDTQPNTDTVFGQGSPFQTLQNTNATTLDSKSKLMSWTNQLNNDKSSDHGSTVGTNNSSALASKSKPITWTSPPNKNKVLEQGSLLGTYTDERFASIELETAAASLFQKYSESGVVSNIDRVAAAVVNGKALFVVLANDAGFFFQSLVQDLVDRCDAHKVAYISVVSAQKVGDIAGVRETLAACLITVLSEDEGELQSLQAAVRPAGPHAEESATREEYANQIGCEHSSTVGREHNKLLSEITFPCLKNVLTFDSNGIVDKEELHFEEGVFLLESVLAKLRERENSIQRELEEISSLREELTNVASNLNSRRDELIERRSKQTVLHKRLSESYMKSKTCLDRLTADGVDMSVEELAALSLKNSSFLPPLDSSLIMDIVDGEPNLVTDPDSLETTLDHLDATDRNESTHASLNTNLVGIDLNPVGVVLTNPAMDPARVRLFWTTDADFSRSPASLLPCIPSAGLLKSILDVSCREVLCLDQSKGGSPGRRRRASLLLTCLDVRQMSITAESDRLIDFTGSSLVIKSQIDPNLALCPYELAGVCADQFCPFQHLERDTLPRELIPLPELSFPNTQDETYSQLKKIEKREDDETVPKLLTNSTATDCRDINSDAGAIRLALASRSNSLQKDDYIELPIDGTFKDAAHQYEKGVASWTEIEAAYATELTSLSDTESSHRIALQAPASFKDVMSRLNCIIVEENGRSLLSPQKKTDDLITQREFLGSVVHWVCLSVHAGRFDASQAVFNHFEREVALWGGDTSLMVEVFRRLADMAKVACDKAYVVSKTDSFFVAYESQLTFALVSQFALSLRAVLHCTRLNDALRAEANDLSSAFCQSDKADDSVEATIRLHQLDTSATVNSVSAGTTTICTLLKSLKDDISHGILLCASASKAIELRDIIDQLQPAWNAAKDILRRVVSDDQNDMSAAFRSILIQMGYCILGCIKRAADFVDNNGEKQGLKTDIAELYVAIDKIVSSLNRMASRIPLLQLLLSPLFAANLSLACTTQLYDRVQNRLEDLLLGTSDRKPGLTCLSELLWSQLLQLRSSLPTPSNIRSIDVHRDAPCGVKFELPAAIARSNRRLAQHISMMGVYPHHITLHGDRIIVRELNMLLKASSQFESQRCKMRKDGNGLCVSSDLSEHCQTILRSMYGAETAQSSQKTFDFTSKPLLHAVCDGHNPLYESFPRFLLVAGNVITQLRLRKCELGAIPFPFHFGHYFPALSVSYVYQVRRVNQHQLLIT